MKNIIFLFPLLVLIACNSGNSESKSETTEQTTTEDTKKTNENSSETPNNETEEQETVKKSENELKWNYSGTIDKIKVKAQIEYGEGTNEGGSGALTIPLTGYYFYETQNEKIKLEGSCSGSGSIYFTAKTSGGDETFDGEFTGSMLEDFSGTWTKGKKSLKFTLKSKSE